MEMGRTQQRTDQQVSLGVKFRLILFAVMLVTALVLAACESQQEGRPTASTVDSAARQSVPGCSADDTSTGSSDAGCSAGGTTPGNDTFKKLENSVGGGSAGSEIDKLIEPDADKDKTGEAESGMVACTMEMKQCSDGSFVGRTGPNCEFSACPDGDNGETKKASK